MRLNKTSDKWQDLAALHTAREIAQQPETWKKTIEIIKDNKEKIENFIDPIITSDNYEVIFTGAGTSEFVGNSIAPIFHKDLRANFKSIATTDLVINPSLYINKDMPTLLVSFGRSGNSPESIAAIDVVNEINPNAKHLVITCNHEGKLAVVEDKNILAIKLPEETNDLSFAMTSSFSNMFIAAYLAFDLANLDELELSVKRISQVADQLLKENSSEIEELVNDFDFNRLIVLGDGELNGFAQESSLKMLELSAGEVVTMFNTPLGFRHGPKSIINSDALTIVFLERDEYKRKYQIDIIKEMSLQRNGNQILVIDVLDDENVKELVDMYISIDTDEIDDNLIGLAYVTIAQMLSLYKSIQLDKSPDNPWPSGMVNRVVQGVTIYPYTYEGDK